MIEDLSFREARRTVALAAAAFLAAAAAPAAARGEDRPIYVDVPVALDSANVVFDMNHPAFEGDRPLGMKYMRLMSQRFRSTGVKGHIVAVFHGESAYMTLSDRAYNALRKVSTGNPYKQLLAELAADGVQLEACAATMRERGWTNDDLLPGVKVDAGALSRIVQLVREGYVQIEP